MVRNGFPLVCGTTALKSRAFTAARRRAGRPFFARGGAVALLLGWAATVNADPLARRFFDFAPASRSNPVVAAIDETVRIPLSELRAYQAAEHLATQGRELSLTEKKALLDLLITEYVLVDGAYRAGVPETADFIRRMETTRTMLLADFLAMRAPKRADEPGATAEDMARIADTVFNAAALHISNEAHAALKRAAFDIERVTVAARLGPIVDSAEALGAKLRGIISEVPATVLVQFAGRRLLLRDVARYYVGLASPRPAVAAPEELLAFLKPLVLPELLAAEAVRRGIPHDPEFQQKCAQNRNALLRFHVQGELERQANAVLRSEQIDQELRLWYERHKGDYAPVDGEHRGRVPPFAEARSRVLADYSVALLERLKAERAAALRKERRITIDLEALSKL